MKKESCEQNVQNSNGQNQRRRFLQSAAVAVAGGLVLGLQSETRSEEESTPGKKSETLLNLPETVLAKVGGSEVVENGDDKIIVARTSSTGIAACSAVCTHKGAILNYDHASGQLVCPNHGARFETSGKVARGPAKRDLKSYQTRAVLGLSPSVEEPK